MRPAVQRLRRARGLDAALLVVVAASLWLLLGQAAWYKIDGQVTVLRIARGTAPHPSHLLSDALTRAFVWLTAPLELSIYQAARAWSACASALALLPLHYAARALGLSRGRAIAAAAMLACAPGVGFYATVVEFHGPLLLFASIALLAATWLGLRPSLPLATATGVLSAFAGCVHASGQPLPALLAPWTIAVGLHAGRRAGVLVRAALGAVLVHLVVLGAVLWSVRKQQPGTSGVHVADYLLAHLDLLAWSDLLALPRTLALEWLLPFLPASVLAFWRPRRSLNRGGLIALAVAALPYGATTFLLMRNADEFGAYLVPLAPAAALLAARATPATLAWLLMLASLALQIGIIRHHDDWPYGDDFARRVAVVEHDARVVLILGEPKEIDASLMHQHHRECCQLLPLDEVLFHVTQHGSALFDAEIAKMHAAGYRVFLTAAARARLAADATGQALAGHLAARYDLQPAAAGGLEGAYLAAR